MQPVKSSFRFLFGQLPAWPVIVGFVIAVLAAVNWAMDPSQAERWLRSMLIIPAFCVVLTLAQRFTLRLRTPGSDDWLAIRRYFRSAVALAVVAVGIRQIAVLSLEIWARLPGHTPDLELERRVLGIATSAVFIVVGNALPKILTPFAMLPPGRAALVTIARRFIGTVWAALGSVMALAFVLTPIEFARSMLKWGAIACILTMLAAIVWMNLAPDRPAPDRQRAGR